MADEVVTMTREGFKYNQQSRRARRRRAKGLCGYCGHERHNRKAGCDCGCPVIFEIDDPAAVARLASMFSEKAASAEGAQDA